MIKEYNTIFFNILYTNLQRQSPPIDVSPSTTPDFLVYHRATPPNTQLLPELIAVLIPDSLEGLLIRDI